MTDIEVLMIVVSLSGLAVAIGTVNIGYRLLRIAEAIESLKDGR